MYSLEEETQNLTFTNIGRPFLFDPLPTQRNESAVSIGQLRFGPRHEGLQESGADVSVTRADGDETASQRRHAYHFLGRFAVENRREEIENVVAVGSGVSQAQAQDGADLQDGGRVLEEWRKLIEKGKRLL